MILLFSIILLTEITLRITCKQKLLRWDNLPYISDTTLAYRYLPNAKGVFSNVAFSNAYIINNLGFPGEHFDIQKKAGCFRIVIVGNSDEDGIHTDGPLNFFYLLRSYFWENKTIEFLNLSIEGSDRSIINTNFVRNECLKYKPNIILLKNTQFPFVYKKRYRCTYKNVLISYMEFSENLDSSKVFIDKYVNKRSLFTNLYDLSYIFRYVCKFYIDNSRNGADTKTIQFLKKHILKNDLLIMAYVRGTINNWEVLGMSKKEKKKYQAVNYSKEESIRLLKEISAELSAQGVKLILFDTYKYRADTMKKLSNQNGFTYLSLDIPRKPEYSFGKLNDHSSQKGHKAIADLLYKALIDSIIPSNILLQSKQKN